MQDIYSKLVITNMNTTAYHPECNDMVERFNCTLKLMLCKHADKFGTRWDKHLPGLLWAYKNMPYESTGKKPSFFLFGVDYRALSENCYHLALLKCQTTMRSLCCHYLQPEPWLLHRLRKLSQSTRSVMTRKLHSAHLRLVSGNL